MIKKCWCRFIWRSRFGLALALIIYLSTAVTAGRNLRILASGDSAIRPKLQNQASSQKGSSHRFSIPTEAKHPHLPLTNNEAERALRHWVIDRKTTFGICTESETKVLLASVVDTCRLRQVLPMVLPVIRHYHSQKQKTAPALLTMEGG